MKTNMKSVSTAVAGGRIGILLAGLFVLAPAWAATEAGLDTYFGSGAGAVTTGTINAFFGAYAGNKNTTGQYNTFIGHGAGYLNTTGLYNTVLGQSAGNSNDSGSGNVFLGSAAGFSETGSYKLYIDDCYSSVGCVAPLIYGEFDNHLLKINGVLHVHANGAPKSQMHFSKGDTDTGGWITSVLDNNFFLSSGARFDADAGNWTQRSPDNSAVIAGSGSLGYRIFANSGNTVGATFTPTVRLHINYNGELGLNQLAVAGTPIQHTSGAHLTSGGVWTDASSRAYKEHIEALSTEEAQAAFAALQPVKFDYTVDPSEKYVGFIAEDVPELVARKDRRSLSPMDIVAVLTKVVQEKSRLLDEQARSIEELRAAVAGLREELGARNTRAGQDK